MDGLDGILIAALVSAILAGLSLVGAKVISDKMKKGKE